MEISGTDRSTALQAASLDPAARALRGPAEQFAQQAASTRVQLTEAGRLRSANAAISDAAKALQATEKPKTADELRAAASQFVSAINNGNKLTAEIAGAGRNAPVARTESADASRLRSAANAAGGDVRRASADAGNRGAEDLRRIGIEAGRDGNLRIDQPRFDAALANDVRGVAQTLDRIGQRVEAVAAEPNSSGAAVGRTDESLTRRTGEAEARRDDVQARGEQSQRVVREQASRSPFADGGAAAYRLVFRL